MLQRASLILILLLVVGAIAQTSKTAPKTTQKKSAKAVSPPAAAKPPVAKKNIAPAKKTTSTAKKRTTQPKKRVVARKRVQSQPTPERYTEIQNALIERGHSPGPVSGIWNASWADALKQFQQDQKLEATGKLDALSLMRLGLGPKRESTAPTGSVEASQPR